MTTFGRAPHHDRVLAVVLVVGERAISVPLGSALVEAFVRRVLQSEQATARPDEGLNGTSEAPTKDECVQPACPTHGEGIYCKGTGAYICRRASCEWRVALSELRTPKPEPACPTCHGEGRTDEGGGCDGRGKRLVYGAGFEPGHIVPCPGYEPACSVCLDYGTASGCYGCGTYKTAEPEPASKRTRCCGATSSPAYLDPCGDCPDMVLPESACPCGEPVPPGAKPCTFADPCLYARGKYWPGTTDRVPEETPAQAHNRIVAVRRARLRGAARRLADRADLLERLSPLDHPYPEEGTL